MGRVEQGLRSLARKPPLGLPRHTFSAVFGATISAGRDHREVFGAFREGFDLASEREARAAAGHPETFGEDDLYPDARPCLAELRAIGLRVGVAGNQTSRSETILRELELPVDWIGTSAGWGVEKPGPEFFERVVAESAVDPAEVLYVGDRLDNDIRPALVAGLEAVLVRRGPWGMLLADDDTEARCLAVLPGLGDLPTVLAQHDRVAHAAR
ncbi:MAG: HAD family hydrolase [Acidimicrobiales bacterium]